jgi:ribonuclease J
MHTLLEFEPCSHTAQGWSASEGSVRESLSHMIQRIAAPGTVALACFSSNIARIQSAIQAGVEAGRRVSIAPQRHG